MKFDRDGGIWDYMSEKFHFYENSKDAKYPPVYYDMLNFKNNWISWGKECVFNNHVWRFS